MGLFGGEGTWSVNSESDTRWNKSGRGFGGCNLRGPKGNQ